MLLQPGDELMDSKVFFEILMRQNSGALLAFLRATVHDPNLIDELYQETMVTAWRRIDDFDRTRPFAPWLRGIAARLIQSSRRKRAGALVLVGEEEVLDHLQQRLAQIEERPGDTWADKLDWLRECLDDLPGDDRAALRLRYEEDLSVAAVAERFQGTVEAWKKRLQRARSRLADCMNRKMSLPEPQVSSI